MSHTPAAWASARPSPRQAANAPARASAIAAAALLSSVSGHAAASASFDGPATLVELGTGGAAAAFAYGINEAGDVTGTIRAGALAAAFRWTPSGGLEVLDRVSLRSPAGGSAIAGSGLVVGAGATGEDELVPEAFSWPAGGNDLDIIGVAAPGLGAVTAAVSEDGAVIAGTSLGPGGFTREVAFVFRAGAFEGLAPAPSGATDADGLFAGGWQRGPERRVLATVWDIAGPSPTPRTLAGPDWSHVAAVDDLGNAAGTAASASGEPAAFRWDADAESPAFAPAPAGTRRASAHGRNAAGDVVGSFETAAGRRAFVWNDAAGFIDLNELLGPADAASWVLTQARDINAAGQVAGFGLYLDTPGGEPEFRAFRLTLPPVAVCPAERDGVPGLDTGDIAAMITEVIAHAPAADINNDGQADMLDLIAYLTLYDAGCE